MNRLFCFPTCIFFSNWDIGRWHLCSVETCFAHTIRLTLHDERVLRHFVLEDDENEKQYPHCPFHLDDRRPVTAIFVATEKLRELMYWNKWNRKILFRKLYSIPLLFNVCFTVLIFNYQIITHHYIFSLHMQLNITA